MDTHNGIDDLKQSESAVGLLKRLLTVLTATAAATPAGATFPGRNGPIAYRQFDPATERFPLLRTFPDDTRVTELTDRPGLFSDWSADGRHIAFDYFDDEGNVQIATMAADGGDLREITSGKGIREVPSWSPDGRRIAFDHSPEPDPSTPGFQTRLWTMRADGGYARPLPMSAAGFDVEPKYSPDGRWIVFARLRPAARDEDWLAAIHIVPARGGRVRQLTPWNEWVEHPTWSPDSRWITFNSIAREDFGTPASTIEAIAPDGRGRHTILATTDTRGGHKPWYSPDGAQILFMCAMTGPDGHYNEDLCVMDADGTDVVDLTPGTPNTFENWPSWGPAPNGRSGD
jgi:Tol biopolymer transport system component